MARDDLKGQVGGGGYSEFTFTVTDAWFGISEAFEAAKNDGSPPTIFCHWVGEVEGIEGVPNLTEDGFHPSYALGPDWEIADEGRSVKFVGSGKEQFRKWYGRLVDEIYEFTKEVPEGQHPFDGDNHPRDAAPWIGTKWFMVDNEYDFGRLGKTSHLMPTQYFGTVDVSGASAPASVPAAAGAPAAAPSASNGLRDTVVNLAKALEPYAEFQKAALAIPGVASDTALVMEIADESKLYAAARS